MKRNYGYSVLFAVLVLLSLSAMICGMVSVFSVGPAVVFGSFLVYNFLPQATVDGLHEKKWFSVCYKIVTSVSSFVAILCSVCLVMMLFYSLAGTTENPTTVIVLGCEVLEDRPTTMMKGRLDTAYDYLVDHPEATVIVAGGQGEHDTKPDSVVMKQYLVERGIAADRIIEENRSQNTYENIRFSTELIEQNGLSTDVLMVSDWYHQVRANRMATQAGLTVTARSTFTNIWLVMPMFFREVCAIVKFLILGV